MCREGVPRLCGPAELNAEPLENISGFTIGSVFSLCEQGQLAAVTFLGELWQPTLKQNRA